MTNSQNPFEGYTYIGSEGLCGNTTRMQHRVWLFVVLYCIPLRDAYNTTTQRQQYNVAHINGKVARGTMLEIMQDLHTVYGVFDMDIIGKPQ